MRRLMIAASTVLLIGLFGCAPEPSPPVGPVQGPATPTVAPPIQQATPDTAVRSYLDWVTIAYRMANSEAVTSTATERQQTFVDAYIQLNRERGQGLAQQLVSLSVVAQSSSGTTATVVTREDWRFRYFSLADISWIGEEEAASYDATYTVVKGPDTKWRVDGVEAATVPGPLK